MIRRAFITIFLVLAIATLAIVTVSWNSEVVIWGKDVWVYKRQIGGVAPMFWEIKQGTRGTFFHGAFFYFRSYCPQPTVTQRPGNTYVITPAGPFRSAHREFGIFRWERNVRMLSINLTPMIPPFPDSAVSERVIVPLWTPLALMTVYPAFAFIHGPIRRHLRKRKGLCLNCGYNLTGNVSGVCPECGEQI